MKVLTNEEINILNKSECLNISTQTDIHNTQEELLKINNYKNHFSSMSLDKIIKQKVEIEKSLQASYSNLYIMTLAHNLITSKNALFNANIRQLAKDLVFMSESLPVLAKDVNNMIACKEAMPYDQKPEDILLKECLIERAKSKSKKIHNNLKEIYREHKMDINENEIERLTEELIALSPILNEVFLTTKSINDNTLQLKAISEILPKQPMNKQIGNNTPPEKAIAKYKNLKKHQRILNNINGKENVRPINPADVDTYKKAKTLIKENNKSKGGR